jgi:hypothetical protein
MNRIILYSTIAIVLFFAQACKDQRKQPLERLSASQIFEKFRKNVVLIKNKSYYQITFDDGTKAWFNEVYDGGINNFYADLSFDENKVKGRAEYDYGTGFFIDPRGIIATNLHVVAPSKRVIADLDYKNSIIAGLHNESGNAARDMADEVAYIKKFRPQDSAFVRDSIPADITSAMPDVDDGDTDDEEAKTPTDSLNRRIDSFVAYYRFAENLASHDFTVTVITVELSIALENATGNAEEYPCHVFSLSREKHIDLSLIQTNDLKLPDGVTGNIDLSGDIDAPSYTQTITNKDTLKVGTPLYLIGYNYGPTIANTTSGTKAQLTKGEVTQENDKYRVLYSIPALPGSSGSPVFNDYGQIVAIHYSGFTHNENFNYGILSFYLKEFIDATPNSFFPL